MSVLYQYKGVWVRDAKDEWIVDDQEGSYKKLKTLPQAQHATILDLGGHIGSFVDFAQKNLAPELIVSVEPDPRNISVWKKNCGRIPRATLIEAAVTQKGGKSLSLHLMDNPAGNSLEFFRGREAITVKAISFKALLDEHSPSLIKCDIEGAEYDLIWRRLPRYVKVLCFEFHQKRAHWLEEQMRIDGELLAQGFAHVRAPRPKQTFTLNTIGIYARN